MNKASKKLFSLDSAEFGTRLELFSEGNEDSKEIMGMEVTKVSKDTYTVKDPESNEIAKVTLKDVEGDAEVVVSDHKEKEAMCTEGDKCIYAGGICEVTRSSISEDGTIEIKGDSDGEIKEVKPDDVSFDQSEIKEKSVFMEAQDLQVAKPMEAGAKSVEERGVATPPESPANIEKVTFCEVGESCRYNDKDCTVMDATADENGKITLKCGEDTIKADPSECHFQSKESLGFNGAGDGITENNSAIKAIAKLIKVGGKAAKAFVAELKGEGITEEAIEEVANKIAKKKLSFSDPDYKDMMVRIFKDPALAVEDYLNHRNSWESTISSWSKDQPETLEGAIEYMETIKDKKSFMEHEGSMQPAGVSYLTDEDCASKLVEKGVEPELAKTLSSEVKMFSVVKEAPVAKKGDIVTFELYANQLTGTVLAIVGGNKAKVAIDASSIDLDEVTISLDRLAVQGKRSFSDIATKEAEAASKPTDKDNPEGRVSTPETPAESTKPNSSRRAQWAETAGEQETPKPAIDPSETPETKAEKKVFSETTEPMNERESRIMKNIQGN